VKPLLLAALLALSLPLAAAPISPATHAAVMRIADEYGVPRSVAHALMLAESSGDAAAIHLEPSGFSSLGLYQLHTDPHNLDWLLSQYWQGGRFDILDPLDNATVALRYLSALHKQFATWERALCFYNAGRVVDVPETTRAYARRICEAGEP
jgi:soluble lytic murein transglycosylase-like protein